MLSINSLEQTDEELEESISEVYGEEIDLEAVKIESNVLCTFFGETKPVSFKDIYNKIKGCPLGDQGLTPTILHIIRLLLVTQQHLVHRSDRSQPHED